MVQKIEYTIRFPLGATFHKPVQYLFIKELYQSIKDKVCLNITKKCQDCIFSQQCIYYYISGECFSFFPGILINKKFYENKTFETNDIINLTFYFIGKCETYRNFLYEFMDTRHQIGRQYFQKVKNLDILIDERKTYSGKVRILSPINKEEDIIEMIRYYNKKYDTSFNESFNLKSINNRFMFDETKYYIDKKRFKILGNTGVYEVSNFSMVLISCGMGAENVIGGGHGQCVLE